MPGVGPITALAIETFAPPMDVFKRGRDFAAWLGLAPRQHSTGGKQVLGKVSKMGQRGLGQFQWKDRVSIAPQQQNWQRQILEPRRDLVGKAHLRAVREHL